MKEFLSGNGEASSKRLFLFLLVCLYIIYFFANLFFHLQLKQSIEDNLFYMIMGMFVGVGLEKWPISISGFLNKKESSQP